MTEILPNPFTPKSGWEPKVFAGREKELKFFRKKIEEAKRGRCDHFLILGDWGTGKTSLLKEFKRIAQSENVLSAIIQVREFKKEDEFMLATQQLILQLPRKLPIKYRQLKQYANYLKGIGVTIAGTGVTLPKSDVKISGDPQVSLLDSLINLWDDLKEESAVIVILLDDAQNYENISGFLTILKNVLSDETLKGTGVQFDGEIKEKVYEYTQGHPFELQILCSNLYDNQIGGKVTDTVWDNSLILALSNLGEILLDSIYDEASPRERELLYLFAKENRPLLWTEIHERIETYKQDFPKKSISEYLKRIVEKKLLIKLEKGLYNLPDRLSGEYILAKGL